MLVLIAAVQMLAAGTSPSSPSSPSSLSSLSLASSNSTLAAADSMERGGFCWRARPAPRCGWILVTELGVSSHRGLTADYGVMFNFDRRSAGGGTMFFGQDESFRRAWISARYRRWLNPRLALEAGAGPVIYCDSNDAGWCRGRRALGVQLQSALHVWGLVAASISFEQLGASNRTYTGIRFGAYAAPLALLVTGILQGITWD